MNRFEIAKSYKMETPIDFLRNLMSYSEVSKDPVLMQYIRNIIKRIKEYIKIQRRSTRMGRNPLNRRDDYVDHDYYDYTKTKYYENDISGLFKGLKIDGRYFTEENQRSYSEIKEFILEKENGFELLATVDINEKGYFTYIENGERHELSTMNQAEYEEFVKFSYENGSSEEQINEVIQGTVSSGDKYLINPSLEIVKNYYEENVYKEVEKAAEEKEETIEVTDLIEILKDNNQWEEDSVLFKIENNIFQAAEYKEGHELPVLKNKYMLIPDSEMKLFKKYSESKVNESISKEYPSNKGITVVEVPTDSLLLDWFSEKEDFIRRKNKEFSLYETVTSVKVESDTWVRLKKEQNVDFKNNLLKKLEINPKAASQISVKFAIHQSLVTKETDDYITVRLPGGYFMKDDNGNKVPVATKSPKPEESHIRIPKIDIEKKGENTYEATIKLSEKFVVTSAEDEVLVSEGSPLGMTAVKASTHFLLSQFKETGTYLSDNFVIVDGKEMEKVTTRDGIVLAYSEKEEYAVILDYEGNNNNVVVPKGITVGGKQYEITEVKDYAFKGKSIEHISLPETIRVIHKGAFADCIHLVDFRCPESLKLIKDKAFQGCSSLENITLNDQLKRLGVEVFDKCYELKKFNIENNPTLSTDGVCLFRNINEGEKALYCFANGNFDNKDERIIERVALEERWNENNINWINYVSSLPEAEADYQKNLINFEKEAWINNHMGVEYTVPADVSCIDEAAFANSRIEKLTLPEGIKEIPDKAFENCILLKKLTIPESVISIGESAFANTNIEEVNLENVNTIKENAFLNSNLKEIELENIHSLGNGAFARCYNMESAIVNMEHMTKEEYSEFAFYETTNARISYKNVPKIKVEIGQKKEEEILEDVKSYVENKLVEQGFQNVSITGVETYGSRTYGEATLKSDLDIVIEYEGEVSETEVFNIIHNEDFFIEGVLVDIKPIKKDEGHTIETYLEAVKDFRKSDWIKNIKNTIYTDKIQSSKYDDIEANQLNNILMMLEVDNYLIIDKGVNAVACQIDGKELSGKKLYEHIEKLLPDDTSEEIRMVIKSLKEYHKMPAFEWSNSDIEDSVTQKKLLATEIAHIVKLAEAHDISITDYANIAYSDIETNKSNVIGNTLTAIALDKKQPEHIRMYALELADAAYNIAKTTPDLKTAMNINDVLYRASISEEEWHNETIVNKDNPNEYISFDVIKENNNYILTINHSNKDNHDVRTVSISFTDFKTMTEALYSEEMKDIKEYAYKTTKTIKNFVRFDETNLDKYIDRIAEEQFLPPENKEQGYQYNEMQKRERSLVNLHVKNLVDTAVPKKGSLDAVEMSAAIKDYILETYQKELTGTELSAILFIYESLQKKDCNGKITTGTTYKDLTQWLSQTTSLGTIIYGPESEDVGYVKSGSTEWQSYVSYLLDYVKSFNYDVGAQPLMGVIDQFNDYLETQDNPINNITTFVQWLETNSVVKNIPGIVQKESVSNGYYEPKVIPEINDEELYQVATDINTPADELDSLASVRYWKVRAAVASNPSTNEKTLVMLSTDPNYNVRFALLQNPVVSTRILNMLKKDIYPLVQKQAEVQLNNYDFSKLDFGPEDVSGTESITKEEKEHSSIKNR